MRLRSKRGGNRKEPADHTRTRGPGEETRPVRPGTGQTLSEGARGEGAARRTNCQVRCQGSDSSWWKAEISRAGGGGAAEKRQSWQAQMGASRGAISSRDLAKRKSPASSDWQASAAQSWSSPLHPLLWEESSEVAQANNALRPRLSTRQCTVAGNQKTANSRALSLRNRDTVARICGPSGKSSDPARVPPSHGTQKR